MNDKSMSNLSSSKCSTSSDKKDSGNNEWSSVPVTYDKEESTHKNEKSATNNQWCSTSK